MCTRESSPESYFIYHAPCSKHRASSLPEGKKASVFVRAPGLLGAHLHEDYQCKATWIRVQVCRAPAALQVFTAPCWRLWGVLLIQTLMKSLCFLSEGNSAPLLRSNFPSLYWLKIDNYWKTREWRGDTLFCLMCSCGSPLKQRMHTERLLLMLTAMS